MSDSPIKLLRVDSSILSEGSVSRELTDEIVARWLEAHPHTDVETLDVAVDAPNHFNADALGIKLGKQETPSDAQRHENEVSERLVSQFLAADVVVIGVPFYNFSIPSQLKAWIDRLAQAGRTFRYTENGPQGLAGDKSVILAVARGGVYSDSEAGQAMEHQESYMKVILGFFGIRDIRVVRAEGVAMGDEARAAAIASARAAIPALVAELPDVQEEVQVA